MTARAPRERHPLSTWLTGIDEISAYAGKGCGIQRVGDALRAKELHGHQFSRKGIWRSKPEWVDAWLEGREPDLAVPVVTRRRAS